MTDSAAYWGRVGALLALLGPGVATAAPPAATVWEDAASGLSFVWIKPACLSGADGSAGKQACVGGYWLGRHEVTRAQWQQVMERPAPPAEQARLPAILVSLQAARDFIARLNARTAPGPRFRLPTPQEWEVACQPGEPRHDIRENRWERSDELKLTAWFRDNKRSATDAEPVGTLAPNPNGVYDLLGNVWEWTEDPTTSAAEREARLPLRGGSFRSDLAQARCGAQTMGLRDDPLPTVGLRLVAERPAP